MLRKLTVACALAAPLPVAGVAAAEDVAPPAPVRFTSLAPDGLQSEVGVRLGFGTLHDVNDDTLFALQLDGQYVAPNGLGGYARFETAAFGDQHSVGDVELGGLYRIDRTDNLAITMRAGLALPTASDDNTAGLLSSFMTRPSDLILSARDTSTLRLSVAPTYHGGQVSLRADFGIDLVVDSPGFDDAASLYHADVGVALQSGHGAGTVEVATLGSLDPDDEGAYHALSLGGQYDLGGATPSVTLAFPFASDNSYGVDGYTVLAGVTGPL